MSSLLTISQCFKSVSTFSLINGSICLPDVRISIITININTLPRKYKSWYYQCSIHTATFDDCDQLEVSIMYYILHVLFSREKVLDPCSLSSTPQLYFLLIHVIDVLPRYVLLLQNLLQETEVLFDIRLIECLCILGIQTSWLL